MATLESSKKVGYIGVWREDTFSDEILTNIAAHARAEKGKKVKIIMNKDGLQIKKQRIFKDDTVEFYPIHDIKTVAKNNVFTSCVMFIQSDTVKKYRIIALRCESEADAYYVTHFFTQLKESDPKKNYNMEWRKRSDTGNWTLRDRSAHNANQHLREVFKERQEQQMVNGDINGNEITPVVSTPTTPKLNGILKQSSVTSDPSFPFTNDHTVHIKSPGKEQNEDMEALLQHTHIAEKLVLNNSRNGSAPRGSIIMPDKPRIEDGKVYSTATIVAAPTNNRRMSGDMALQRQYQTVKQVSGRNSVVVFDSASLKNVGGTRKLSSLRTRNIVPNPNVTRRYSTSTTLQRSIEDTYTKPAIMQPQLRRSSSHSIIHPRDHRRYTIQVVGDNPFQLRNGHDVKF